MTELKDCDPVLQALSARFFCIEELLKSGDIDGCLSIIKKCKRILLLPTETNIEAAMRDAGYFHV